MSFCANSIAKKNRIESEVDAPYLSVMSFFSNEHGEDCVRRTNGNSRDKIPPNNFTGDIADVNKIPPADK